jgi:hypothetical protein
MTPLKSLAIVALLVGGDGTKRSSNWRRATCRYARTAIRCATP